LTDNSFRTLAESRKDTALLEKYWEANKPEPGQRPGQLTTDEAPVSSADVTFPSLANQKRKGHTRNRSASDGAALVAPEHKLSPYHPAWSLTSLLDKFGPLIFPIHRAALLRQRILISCHAPVHEICDFGMTTHHRHVGSKANNMQYITSLSCPTYPSL
jgi:hypothetical protein